MLGHTGCFVRGKAQAWEPLWKLDMGSAGMDRGVLTRAKLNKAGTLPGVNSVNTKR